MLYFCFCVVKTTIKIRSPIAIYEYIQSHYVIILKRQSWQLFSWHGGSTYKRGKCSSVQHYSVFTSCVTRSSQLGFTSIFKSSNAEFVVCECVLIHSQRKWWSYWPFLPDPVILKFTGRLLSTKIQPSLWLDKLFCYNCIFDFYYYLKHYFMLYIHLHMDFLTFGPNFICNLLLTFCGSLVLYFI